MTQITRQADLPVDVGGSSPDGTVGWGLIYSDWDLNGVLDNYNPGGHLDVLRFKVI
jgi:hypothetical protein